MYVNRIKKLKSVRDLRFMKQLQNGIFQVFSFKIYDLNALSLCRLQA